MGQSLVKVEYAEDTDSTTSSGAHHHKHLMNKVRCAHRVMKIHNAGFTLNLSLVSLVSLV